MLLEIVAASTNSLKSGFCDGHCTRKRKALLVLPANMIRHIALGEVPYAHLGYDFTTTYHSLNIII